jgi:hypothetical protein
LKFAKNDASDRVLEHGRHQLQTIGLGSVTNNVEEHTAGSTSPHLLTGATELPGAYLIGPDGLFPRRAGVNFKPIGAQGQQPPQPGAFEVLGPSHHT